MERKRLQNHGVVAASVPEGLDALERFVRERLRCPLWPESEEDMGLSPKLTLLWRNVVINHCVADEFDYISESEMWATDDGIDDFWWDLSLTDDQDQGLDLRPLAINISRWYQLALDDFGAQTRLLVAPIAGPQRQEKHFPTRTCRTYEDLRRCSNNKVGGRAASQFLYGIDESILASTVRAVEVEVFDSLIGASKFRTSVDCMCGIGVVEGEEASHIAIEWSPDVVHAYPVTDAEARDIAATGSGDRGEPMGIDDLQGFGRQTRD